MVEPNRLSARELAAKLAGRELRALDVVDACLERIAARDPQIRAWAHLDPECARRQARALDAGPIVGPLQFRSASKTSSIPLTCRPSTDRRSIAAIDRPRMRPA
jgi:hypothetical protein